MNFNYKWFVICMLGLAVLASLKECKEAKAGECQTIIVDGIAHLCCTYGNLTNCS